MPVYDYEIGTTSTTTNIELLSPPLPPPRSVFIEYTREYDKADGQVGGDGYPMAIWTFDLLTTAQLAKLRTYCSGRSAAVYIRTRNANEEFVKYSAIMVWPSDLMKKRVAGKYLDVQIEFRRLVAV